MCCVKLFKMKRIILRSFNRTEDKGSKTGTTVCLRMNNNPEFASEQPLIDALKVVKEAYEMAKADAATRDSIKIAVKNERLAAYINQLDKVADAVEMKADGDIKIVQDAGFEVRVTTNRNIDDLATPVGLAAEDLGRLGAAKVAWKKDPDAVNYGIEYLVEGETVWQNGTYSTSSSAIVTGLPSGKYISFRIYAMGRKGRKSDTTAFVTVLVS